jgi:hypothetical protein
VIEAREVKQAVEEQDAYLIAKGMTVGFGLARGGFERDGKIARVNGCDLGGRGKAEDVGGLVLATEAFVEPAEGGIIGEENVYFSGNAGSPAGMVEEAAKTGWGEFGLGRFDGNHAGSVRVSAF